MLTREEVTRWKADCLRGSETDAALTTIERLVELAEALAKQSCFAPTGAVKHRNCHKCPPCKARAFLEKYNAQP